MRNYDGNTKNIIVFRCTKNTLFIPDNYELRIMNYALKWLPRTP